MVLPYALDERRPPISPYADLSDDQLQAKCAAEMRYHDSLIDTVEMGDERIYLSGKKIDVMLAEIRRRAGKAEGRS